MESEGSQIKVMGSTDGGDTWVEIQVDSDGALVVTV